MKIKAGVTYSNAKDIHSEKAYHALVTKVEHGEVEYKRIKGEGVSDHLYQCSLKIFESWAQAEVNMTQLGTRIMDEIKSATSGERLNDFLDGYLDIAMSFHSILAQIERLNPEDVNLLFLEVLEGSPDYAEHFLNYTLGHMVDWNNFEDIKKAFNKKILKLGLRELK